MAKITFGEKSWDEEGASGGGGSRNDFLAMKEYRKYVVRALKNPHEFAMHWVETDEGTKRVNCAARDCFVCKAGVKASIRYLVPVLYRGDSTCKIAEFGPLVHKQIHSLVHTPGWGSPFEYDLCIDKRNTKTPTEMYFVTPIPKAPLTPKEKAAAADFLEKIDLEALSRHFSNEEIAQKIGMHNATKLGYQGSSAGDANAPAAQTQSYNFEDLENGF